MKNVLHVYESGELYFLQTTEYDSNIDDYIEDDLLNNPSINDIKNETIKRQEHTLYYWNGTKIQKVGETATIIFDEIFDAGNDSSGFELAALNSQYAEKKPVMIYEAYHFDEMQKIKLSELPYVSKKQIISAIESEFHATGKMTLVTENETQNVEQIQVDPLFDSQNICISPKGDEIFYVKDVTVYEGDGNINRIEILDGKAQMPKFYDEISYTNYVLCKSMLFTQNGTTIYFKNFKRDCDLGDLCIDQNLIASNVKNDTVKVYGNGEMIGFIENWDSGNGQGTLQLYVDEGKKELAIDVHEYEILSTDCIVYLQDYDINTGKGNLYIYKNGVVEKIDDNVEGIIGGTKNIEYGINQKSRSFG